MYGIVSEILEERGINGEAATPASNNLFTINEDSEALQGTEVKSFHSTVQKLLYLAKRTRPDLLTAVSFLTTRVQKPTREDDKKLERVLKYLNKTKELKLRLTCDEPFILTTYVDASFAVHPDAKGHTGIVTTLGGGAVLAKSSKQKLVARSSTESELVALGDAVQYVLWTRNFLLAQGIKLGPAVVAQDNKSTIALAEKGRSTSNRTRHIAIRYFFVHDRIKSGEVQLEHLPTEQMLADFLSKPLQGELFRTLRDRLLNVKTNR
jgi:hypothetical protein